VSTSPARPLVRIEEAALGASAQVRLVVSGVDDLDVLQRAWSSSGATLARHGDRLHATTTVQAFARAARRALGPRGAELELALLAAVSAWGSAPPPLVTPLGALATHLRPLVMGVVNVTDDSFSDGGLLYPADHPARAIAHGRSLLAQGADLLDVGGESSRPGAEPVAEDEELHRVLPVVRSLADDGAVVSIDTVKPAVARAAVAAGAVIVNDVSGARDPALLEAAAETGAAYVLMHTRGEPRDMQQRTQYDDVVAEVFEFLADGLARVAAAGVARERVAVDPGIGFAKTVEQNLALLRALPQLRGLGRPVLVGVSRKSFLGRLTAAGPTAEPPPTDDRLEAGLACAALAVSERAALLRVHDVAPTVRAARVARAVATGATNWPPAVRVAPGSAVRPAAVAPPHG